MVRSFEDFPNLVSMFFSRARQHGDAPFLWRKHGDDWQPTSWAETARQVARLAEALAGLGLNRGDRVALVSENRPEGCIAALAIMAAGCVTVPTYTTHHERDHLHILKNHPAQAVLVSTTKLARTPFAALTP